MAFNRTLDINHVLSTTLDHFYRSGKMHDAIFKSNPTFATMHAGGRMKTVAGGYQIQVNLMYGKNTTVGSYSGYEVLDVAPQDGMTSAFYDWAQYAVSVAIDGRTEFQNSGAAAIIDLLGQKTEQATMSLSEQLNIDLLATEGITTAVTGNGGKNIIGIPLFCQIAPGGGGTVDADVGGIDQSSYSWWQNQYQDAAHGTSFVGLVGYIRNQYNKCTDGFGGPPDLLVSGMGAHEVYEAHLAALKRYADDGAANTVSSDFGGLKYKRATWYWDAHAPDMQNNYDYDNASYAYDSIFLLNTKFLQLLIGKGKDFKWTKFQKPEDQDARVANCLFYGQLVCSNRRKQGVIFDVTTTPSSYS